MDTVTRADVKSFSAILLMYRYNFVVSGESLRRGGPDVCMAAAQTSWASRARAAPASAMARRSEEHTSELQSLMRISYAVFCLKKKKKKYHNNQLKKKQTTN